MHKDPTIIRKETDPNGPIGKLPKQVLDSLDGFYKDAKFKFQICLNGFPLKQPTIHFKNPIFHPYIDDKKKIYYTQNAKELWFTFPNYLKL